MDRRGLVAIALVTLVFAACNPGRTGPGPASSTPVGSPGPTSTDGTGPSSTLALPIANLRFKCGTFAFGADVLSAPVRQDQDAQTPAAAAVRQELASAGGTVPARGWRLIGSDATHAELIALDPNGGLDIVAVMVVNGQWTLDLIGSCYAAVVVAEGVGPATWSWGSPGVPGPATRTFDALVTERACANGRPPIGRVVGPVVVPTAEAVLVFFGVHPLPSADCPSNPSIRIPVDLGEALGARQLLDGGHLPFGDPMSPAP